jgi:hypothetical protein
MLTSIAFIARIQSSLGPDPSEEEIVEATNAAVLGSSVEERQSINVAELRRRRAAYRSIEIG